MAQQVCEMHGLPTTQGTSFCSYECQMQDYLQYQNEPFEEEAIEFADIFEYNEDYQDETGCNYNYNYRYSNLDSSSLLGSELTNTLDTTEEELEEGSFAGILYECVWCNQHHLLANPCKEVRLHNLESGFMASENTLDRNNQSIQSNYQKWLSLSVN